MTDPKDMQTRAAQLLHHRKKGLAPGDPLAEAPFADSGYRAALKALQQGALRRPPELGPPRLPGPPLRVLRWQGPLRAEWARQAVEYFPPDSA